MSSNDFSIPGTFQPQLQRETVGSTWGTAQPATRLSSRVARRQARRRRWGNFWIAMCIGLLIYQGTCHIYNWTTPPRTLFMLTDPSDEEIIFEEVKLEHISRIYLAAVLLHEDDQLGTRQGPFDVSKFIERAKVHLNGGEDEPSSSIPQQLVKNIYLVRGEQDIVRVVRKGVEAFMSYPFNITVSDTRQLELYMNYAQFGPGIYGICAATWYYYNRPPWDGDFEIATLLAGVLPAGEDARRAEGGGLDVSANVDLPLREAIWNALKVVPDAYANYGGWENVMATMGIYDTAEDHAAERDDPLSCSVMPESVAYRLKSEGAWWSEEYGG